MSDFGAIVDQACISNQRDNRDAPITRVIWHHQASTNDDATIDMMVTGSRQVSATYTVDNDDYGGRGWSRITGVVPERYRPWTSASHADEGALTIEVCNSSGDPSWGISDASHEACAHIAAYAWAQYGIPLRRATDGDTAGHLGHNEVIDMFGDGYATACPMHVDIDGIIARADQLLTKDNNMSADQWNYITEQLNEIRRLTGGTANPRGDGEFAVPDQVTMKSRVGIRPYKDNPPDTYTVEMVLSELLELARTIRDEVTR